MIIAVNLPIYAIEKQKLEKSQETVRDGSQ